MNKNAIQKYAVWARKELIEQIKQRAYQYGISDKGYGDENATVIAGRVLTPDEKRQRREFVVQIKAHGFEQAVEEVAYTWFNRFVALRYMEVNDYLPTHIRVFSDANGSFNPEILKDVLHLDLPGLNKAKVSELLNDNKTEELYRYLLLTQCNALNDALPEMFEKLGSYTEMLLPNNILKPDSVLGRLVTDIDEDDWKDQVQIIGWLYQYYVSEKHNQIVNIYKGTVKKEDIPAATQLFTTDWVVRYMVDNSLGRYWIERHPESKLREKLQYFVVPKSGEINFVNESISPQELTFFDPCMGSGHILVYAFDVLMEIYKECGYGERDAAVEIVKNNIFGLDIDERCSQLAYFAVMMKARSYDRRFLDRKIKPHVLSIKESNTIGSFTNTKLMTNAEQNKIGEYIVDVFRHAKEIGSLKTVESKDYEGFQQYLKRCEENAAIDIEFSFWQMDVKPLMEQLAEQAKILSSKYAVVCTNPPYMNKLESHLKDFVVNEYKPYSGDLFSVFIYRNFDFCKEDGYSAFMTPFVWMSIKSYKELREYILANKSITTLIQMEYSAFEEATVPICSFVLKNTIENACGLYFDLSDFVGGMEVQRVKVLEAIANPECGYFYETSQLTFTNIPSSPITAFWVSKNLADLYNYPLIGSKFTAKEGVGTRNDDVFLKLHWEVASENIGRNKRWILTDKAGGYRKWYLGSSYVMDWEDNGYRIKNYRNEDGTLRSRPQNTQFLFKDGISWGKIGSGASSFRYREEGYGFNDAAPTLFGQDPFPLLAALNTNIYRLLLKIRGGTLNMTCGVIEELPMLGYVGGDTQDRIKELSKVNCSISRIDWDSFETSWDFKRHPLICEKRTVEAAFSKWECEADERFDTLKANEEELNRIFIATYGLQDELTLEVEDKDVTVRRADLGREIRSLISYAVGCMFGRYSLDIEGLVYAGGEWDSENYKTFVPDRDNILPICDDEYFDDDILGRFVEFVRVVYGTESLEENLKFIADALGGKGTPREVIRNYFLNEFYKDHCKTYQKRPIYWLFDSGKKNGFKALIYMHRYSRDLLAKLRTDYVHEQQERYRTQLSHIATALNTATSAERGKLLKQQDKLTEQLKEITNFEEKVHHLADQNIEIDLDDGVKKNYELFADVLAKI